MPALGSSLVLLAVGAILAFAVSATVSGVAIVSIGVILMIVGAIGIVMSLLFMMSFSPWGSHTEVDHIETVDHVR